MVPAGGVGGRGTRAEKVRRIFERFDVNGDGGLNREEMAALLVSVNPRVKFSDDQISAILDEVFRAYADFIAEPDVGLTLPGLIRTYDDGAGDVDRDFDALGLSLSADVGGEESDSIGAASDVVVASASSSTAPTASGVLFDDGLLASASAPKPPPPK